MGPCGGSVEGVTLPTFRPENADRESAGQPPSSTGQWPRDPRAPGRTLKSGETWALFSDSSRLKEKSTSASASRRRKLCSSAGQHRCSAPGARLARRPRPPTPRSPPLGVAGHRPPLRVGVSRPLRPQTPMEAGTPSAPHTCTTGGPARPHPHPRLISLRPSCPRAHAVTTMARGTLDSIS